MSSAALDAKTPSWLYGFSVFLVGMTLLLILAGGLVTSREAGLAVPDWPLSYGRLFPPMVGNIFWEHGHRIIAGTVALLTLVLAVWIQIQGKRTWLKRLAWAAFGAVILQAALGGLTVLYLLPPAVSIVHACLAQTFFCLTVALAYFLNPAPSPQPSPQRGEGEILKSPSPLVWGRGKGEGESPRRLAVMTAAFIYLQLILGASVRHTSFSAVPHVVVAFLVFLHVALLVSRIMRFQGEDKTLTRFALGMGFFTLLQVFLGIGAFVFTRMLERGHEPPTAEVFFTASHQTLGAAILAMSIWICLRVWR